MKRKGQASGEYIALVAGGAIFVLIVVVAANAFFNAPAKQSVIEQGSLVQQQFGSLSKAMEKGKPLTYRKPIVYEGLAEAPVDFTYGVQSCIHRVEFWSNLSGTYELTNTIEQTVDPEATGDYNVFLNMTQDSIVAPGLYEFNVNVCNCQNSCQWMYADENNTPINQIIEIVPHADPRYAAAKQKYFNAMDINNRLNPNQGPIALSSSVRSSWSCDLGTPIVSGNTQITGDTLQNATLTCNLNGRQIHTTQEVHSSSNPTLRILDENAEGQSICTLNVCNSTTCIDSQPSQANVCTPAAQGVNSITIGQNNDGILQFGVCSNDACNTWDATAHFNLQANMAQYTATLILYGFDETAEKNLGQVWPGQQNKPITVHSRYQSWKIKICNANNQCTYSSRGEVQQSVLAIV